MSLSSVLETLFRRTFWLSALALAWVYFYKDRLPEPSYYDFAALQEPLQEPISESLFTTRVNEQHYTITPKFAYQLDGVVVSLHDADQLNDIWHHKRWQDFLNLRDLCVIWGENVQSGVYHRMKFHNDTWTCWASWPDTETGNLFKMNALANNHLLADKEAVKNALMAAEPGDHIRLRGMLVEYANASNGFHRGTSTIREDTGNGACETIYLDEFAIVNKANRKLRRLYTLLKWLTVGSGVAFLIMLPIAPFRIRH
ncbi:MAG: hypothetical protein ACU83P_04970 [Gammaproteobacteria bacterium]